MILRCIVVVTCLCDFRFLNLLLHHILNMLCAQNEVWNCQYQEPIPKINKTTATWNFHILQWFCIFHQYVHVYLYNCYFNIVSTLSKQVMWYIVLKVLMSIFQKQNFQTRFIIHVRTVGSLSAKIKKISVGKIANQRKALKRTSEISTFSPPKFVGEGQWVQKLKCFTWFGCRISK